MCEHAAWGGGSRPLHLRPVDTICLKLNKIGLQNDGDRHSSIAYNEKPEVKSNLCQGINIYRAINAYKPNSTMIKFNSALSRRGQARPKLCPACLVYMYGTTVTRGAAHKQYTALCAFQNIPRNTDRML